MVRPYAGRWGVLEVGEAVPLGTTSLRAGQRHARIVTTKQHNAGRQRHYRAEKSDAGTILIRRIK